MTGLCRLVGSGESTDKEKEGRCAALGQVRKEEMGKGHLGKGAEAHAFHSGAKHCNFLLNVLLNSFYSNQAMSNSKLVPPFVFDLLCYLNRDQLERFSIVCRLLKNFTNRYFHSKPCRIFDRLHIRGGLYALVHNNVQWHPNREDYNVQQFLAGQKCSIQNWLDFAYYPFAEMCPYLSLSVRIKQTVIHVAGGITYNIYDIVKMESIAYLWTDGDIKLRNARSYGSRIVDEDFQPILNSPTILQCRLLKMDNTVFSFKDYKILYTLNIIEIGYANNVIDFDFWPQFLEQPGVKPVVVLRELHQENIDNLLDRLSKAFSSAVFPNAFKIAFTHDGALWTKFRERNKTSGEILELREGLPTEYKKAGMWYNNKYTLERSSV